MEGRESLNKKINSTSANTFLLLEHYYRFDIWHILWRWFFMFGVLHAKNLAFNIPNASALKWCFIQSPGFEFSPLLQLN